MITLDQVRAICLSMPVVEEHDGLTMVDYRVKNKIFAKVSKTQGWSDLRIGKEEQFLLAGLLAKYQAPGDGGPASAAWIRVRFFKATEAEVSELIWKAWRHTAPARVALQY